MFVASDACSPDDVLAILRFNEDLGPQEQQVMNYFKKAIRKLNETGIAHLSSFSYLAEFAAPHHGLLTVDLH